MKNLLRHLAMFFITIHAATAVEVQKVTPIEAAQRVKSGKAVLVDVREAAEWSETGVAAPATLLPKSDLDGERRLWKKFLAQASGKEIILYCRSGKRAGVVAETLAKEGHSVANAGGMNDWRAAGLPTRKADEPATK